MFKTVLIYLTSVLFLIICRGLFPGFIRAAPIYSIVIQQDPSDKRLLLNGRIWKNQYSKVMGDQFFLTNTFLNGSVTLTGQTYNNLYLMYDIYNDELLLSIQSKPIIIMNKEMVDSFNLVFENRNYQMINAGTDSSGALRGYVNILYNGPSALFIKYTKVIQPLAVDGKYDLFYQEHRIYVRKGTEIVDVSGKRKLLTLLEDKKKEIMDYMKRTKLKIKRKDPGTYIPILKYYDSIRE